MPPLFSAVTIRSTRNGILPVDGYREDLAQADAIHVKLFDTASGLSPPSIPRS